MSSPNQNQNAFSDLLTVFTSGIKNMASKAKLFAQTSGAILSFGPIKQDLKNDDRKYLSDVKYAYLVFEYILVLFILSLIFSADAGSDEVEELMMEVLLMLLFFLEVILVIGIGSVCHRLFFRKLPSREVQGLFIYSFCMPFFPSYLITYISYDLYGDNEEAFNGVVVLLFFGFLLFLLRHFYLLSREAYDSKVKSFLLGALVSIGMSVLLLLSIALVTGAAFGEDA